MTWFRLGKKTRIQKDMWNVEIKPKIGLMEGDLGFTSDGAINEVSLACEQVQ